MKFVVIVTSFLLLQNVVAQDSLKNRFVELGLSSNYSTSYSQVTNKMGGGLGLYFNTQKQNKKHSVRFGVDYQITRMAMDSISLEYHFSQNNTTKYYDLSLSFHQVRLFSSFPIQLFKVKTGSVFVEPRCYFNIPLPVRINATEVKQEGAITYINQRNWKGYSTADIGFSFAIGMNLPIENYNFKVRLIGNYGPFGNFYIGGGPGEQAINYNNFVNLNFIWAFKMK
jgi:hypothetical protein